MPAEAVERKLVVLAASQMGPFSVLLYQVRPAWGGFA
jgi:hypothetical protein